MDKKLYNIIFPTYMLVTFVPSVILLLTIVGNFVIDSLVILLISNIFFKKIDMCFYKKIILKVWLLGYLSDFLASVFLILLEHIYNEKITNKLTYVIFPSLGIVFASILIFIFNYFISFRFFLMSKKQKILYSLILSILTAPYTFLIPDYLFY